MGKRKPSRLTKEQHKRYGLFLKLFRDGFLHLEGILANTYPKSHPIVKACEKIVSGLDSLKCSLDDEVCAHYPQWEDNIECYYGDRPWQGRNEAIIEAVANLEFPERRSNDLEQILDYMGSHLTEMEYLEVYEIKTRLDCLMKRASLDERTLEWMVKSLLDRQQYKLSQAIERGESNQ